jgi:diaminopimelate epimerase
VAGVLTGRSARSIRNHLSGGVLELEWEEGGSVFMTGPAVEVFSGEYQLQ